LPSGTLKVTGQLNVGFGFKKKSIISP